MSTIKVYREQKVNKLFAAVTNALSTEPTLNY